MGGRVVLVILPTATSSGGNTLVGFSATLTPGTDARGLKPVGAFGSDPFAKPTNTKTSLLGLREEQGCLPHWRDGGKRQTPELAGATTCSLRSPPVPGHSPWGGWMEAGWESPPRGVFNM